MMKKCDYCGTLANDEEVVCARCNASSFKRVCNRCGATYAGSRCPQCAQEELDERAKQVAIGIAAEQARKANTGLSWKMALTVLMPYIGGYFLIAPFVRRGFRIFAVIWCIILAAACSVGGKGVFVAIASTALCLAPVGVGLWRIQRAAGTLSDRRSKVYWAIFAAIAAVLFLLAAFGVTAPLN